MRSHMPSTPTAPNNLSIYRLEGFSGCRALLRQLHHWLTEGDRPAIAISGDQGNGKSTLSVATAWNLIHHYPDGIIRVGAAGTNPFRMYDIVREMDTVLGTTLTRVSEDRWGISILEQLYRRQRLVIVDKLAGATQKDLAALIDVVGHLQDTGGKSRILLIDRNFSAGIAGLVGDQHLHLDGLDKDEAERLIERRAPAGQLTCGRNECFRDRTGHSGGCGKSSAGAGNFTDHDRKQQRRQSGAISASLQ